MSKILKAILLIILASVLLLAGCPAGSQSPSAAQVGKQAPDFTLQNLDGQSVSLSDFLGKPVLLNFWATWCPPCRHEMPYLQEVYEEWSGKGLVVLAINMGESPFDVKTFTEAYNLSIPALVDVAGNAAHEYNIMSIPTSFFIDSDGIIKQKIIGAFPSTAAIERYLGQIIP